MFFDQAIKRIDWEGREPNLNPTKFKLLNEYFRHAALWSTALDAPPLFPFGDYPSAIAPKIQASALNSNTLDLLEGLQMSMRERILVEYIAIWEHLPAEKKA